jgi:hypothetical protein
VEGNKTDFSIVAPKVDPTDHICSQSELDILAPLKNKDITNKTKSMSATKTKNDIK